jgi:hypothetical protein
MREVPLTKLFGARGLNKGPAMTASEIFHVAAFLTDS